MMAVENGEAEAEHGQAAAIRQVYIYCDEGSCMESVKGWLLTLTTTLGYPTDHVHLVKATAIVACLKAQCAEETTLIMPGGADLPFLRRLGRDVITVIQEVVAHGGSYVGSCAGAYFASAACIFERHDERLRVVGDRPLKLFPYAAVGAVRENFRYGSEAGATLEILKCNFGGREFSARVYCNGGAAWDIKREDKKTNILARYADCVLRRHGVHSRVGDAPAAVVMHRYGLAGRVILSGVHPEMAKGGAENVDGEEGWRVGEMDGGRLELLREIGSLAGLWSE